MAHIKNTHIYDNLTENSLSSRTKARIQMAMNPASKNRIDKEMAIREFTQLWDPIGQDDITLLRQHIELIRLKDKQVIFEETETPTRVMCLMSGKIKVFKKGPLGKRQIIRIMKPMDFFGFRAPFAGEDHRTGTMTLESCVIATIPVEVMKDIMRRNFSVSKFFIQELSYHLGQVEERAISLIQKHLRGRLADTLLFIKDNYGMDEDNVLEVSLSREDMAALANMTTSNAIRTLSTFANEGLISTNGRHIKLLNIEELRHISQQG